MNCVAKWRTCCHRRSPSGRLRTHGWCMSLGRMRCASFRCCPGQSSFPSFGCCCRWGWPSPMQVSASRQVPHAHDASIRTRPGGPGAGPQAQEPDGGVGRVRRRQFQNDEGVPTKHLWLPRHHVELRGRSFATNCADPVPWCTLDQVVDAAIPQHAAHHSGRSPSAVKLAPDWHQPLSENKKVSRR
jgi:hypothetical protein